MARGLERPPWWAVVVIVVCLVFLIVGLPYALNRGGKPLPQAELNRLDAAASAAGAADALAASSTAPPPGDAERQAECAKIQEVNATRGDGPVGNGPRTIAVLGDSYAQGLTLADPLTSWPAELAAQAEATVWVYAVAGSGFSQSTYCDGAEYAARAPEALAQNPELVIVQGGLNDTGSSNDEIRRGYENTMAALGDAEVVVIGPPLAPQRDPNEVRRVDGVLTAETRTDGVRYVSALDWELTYGPDRLHPDVAGQKVFGEQVAAALTSR